MKTNQLDTDEFRQIAAAGLAVLLALELTMLLAMLSRTPPHPPLEVALFALGPFLGASISLALAGLMLGSARTVTSRAVSLAAVLFALISFGPQKWLDPAFPKIWPAVIVGQLAAMSILWACWRASKH